jgi:hypothetical protein
MAEESARIELARRYFTHFGPTTVKDAAYFFGTTQTKVKSWLKQLPVSETTLDGKSYFFIDSTLPDAKIPACLFLAGFDQLMLGYEKTESLFLPKEHMRDIFNLAGIVRPAILVNGTVVGWWNLKNRKLKITLFSPADRELISQSATGLWNDLKQIEYL